MLVYAGIDEAGYGPLFGPLVVARTVFILENHPPAPPLPSLWRLLQQAVCRNTADSRDRVAVDDSKRLYTAAHGLHHLERGVLGFLGQNLLPPDSLQELLGQLAPDEASGRLEHPCYAGDEKDFLPVSLDPRRLLMTRRRLVRLAERTGVRLQEIKSAIVLEDRFNQMVTDCGNKALCTWTFVASHLQAIWTRYGHLQPQVVIDRQGGRIYYFDLLANLFPEATLCILMESPAISRYRLKMAEREMEVTIQVESERDHLPVALASMTAKYVRELLMQRFSRFWRRHAPLVRPTCGYGADGRRFLREIEPLLAGLQLDRNQVVRRC